MANGLLVSESKGYSNSPRLTRYSQTGELADSPYINRLTSLASLFPTRSKSISAARPSTVGSPSSSVPQNPDSISLAFISCLSCSVISHTLLPQGHLHPALLQSGSSVSVRSR